MIGTAQQLRRVPIKTLGWVALVVVLAFMGFRYVADHWGARTIPVEYFARVSCSPDKPFLMVAKDGSGAVVGRSTIAGHVPVNMTYCLARGTMDLHSDGPITVSLAPESAPNDVLWTGSYTTEQIADDDFGISASPR
jgi:hypothetical protein